MAAPLSTIARSDTRSCHRCAPDIESDKRSAASGLCTCPNEARKRGRNFGNREVADQRPPTSDVRRLSTAAEDAP